LLGRSESIASIAIPQTRSWRFIHTDPTKVKNDKHFTALLRKSVLRSNAVKCLSFFSFGGVGLINRHKRDCGIAKLAID